jgi:two-component system, NarL family, sensor kinase
MAAVTRKPFPEGSDDTQGPFQTLFNASLDAILIADDSRRYVDANPAACELLGVDRTQIIKFRIDDFVSPRRRAEIEIAWESFLRNGKKKGEYELVRLDGIVRQVEFSDIANFLPGRHISTLRDVTKRNESEKSLRALSGKLLQMQDEERRRIARNLHDSAGQLLGALKMILTPLEAKLTKQNPELVRPVIESISLVDELTAEIRTVSHLLHPPLLDELGLESALRLYVDGFGARSRIKVDLDYLSQGDDRLPREVGIAVFRIVQESLTNIHRHSGSPTASVRCTRSDGEITCEISDQGKGIPLEKMSTSSLPGSFGVGLRGMQERVRQLGGTLKIESNGHGTSISATLPVSKK